MNNIQKKYIELIKIQDKEAKIYSQLEKLTKNLSIEEIIVEYIKANKPIPVLIPDISFHLAMLGRQKSPVDIFHIIRNMIINDLLPERTNKGYVYYAE